MIPWVAALLLLDPGEARACSLSRNFPHVVDPDEAAVDDTPPEAIPSAEVAELDRGDIGCSDCGGGMFVMIEIVPPTDDRTASEEIGYDVEVVEGEFPFFVDEEPIQGSRLFYHSSREFVGFSATLEIRPVDRAGNVGPPIRVEVDSGGGGCNMSLGSGGGAAWLAIVALQCFARRRRLTASAA